MIDYQNNRKNRGYNTAVISAPIVIRNSYYYMAAVVIEEPIKNTYYLHEVALQKKEASSVFKTGTDNIRTPSTGEASLYSLLRKLQNVNSDSGGSITDADTKTKIASAYGKDSNLQGFINRSQILYIDPDKERTRSWFVVNRLQLPLLSTNYGFVNSSLSQNQSSVNNSAPNNDVNTKNSLKLTDSEGKETKNSRKRCFDNIK